MYIVLLALGQAALGARVAWRLARTGGHAPIRVALPDAVPNNSVRVVVPVLNEADRLAECLAGLLAQGPEVDTIVLADTGSTDTTCKLVLESARRDERIRLLQAGPAPVGWNGKVWAWPPRARAFPNVPIGCSWWMLMSARDPDWRAPCSRMPRHMALAS